MQHFHHDTETGEEALRGLQGQLFRIGNHITDIVWQTTVGIGDIPVSYTHLLVSDFCPEQHAHPDNVLQFLGKQCRRKYQAKSADDNNGDS